MPNIKLPDGDAISYRDSGGTGPVLVLAHPFSGNELSWDACTPYFAAAGYRVIAFSRRGYYQSAPVADTAQSDDLAGLLDALGINDPIDIVGVAAGTTIVFDWMLSYPERSRLGVAACGLMGINEQMIKHARDILQPDWFKALPHDARELSASYRFRHPEALEAWHRIFEMNHLDHAVSPQKAASRITFDTLSAISDRLMFVGGESDLYAPPALMEAVVEKLPGTKLEILRQCGHAAHIEQPAVFADAVLRFLHS